LGALEHAVLALDLRDRDAIVGEDLATARELRQMMAIVLAGAFVEKFGGDSICETMRNYTGYMAQVRSF